MDISIGTEKTERAITTARVRDEKPLNRNNIGESRKNNRIEREKYEQKKLKQGRAKTNETKCFASNFNDGKNEKLFFFLSFLQFSCYFSFQASARLCYCLSHGKCSANDVDGKNSICSEEETSVLPIGCDNPTEKRGKKSCEFGIDEFSPRLQQQQNAHKKWISSLIPPESSVLITANVVRYVINTKAKKKESVKGMRRYVWQASSVILAM